MPKVSIDDVEVLVHITAPCNCESEARWRNLVESYLYFEPISRHKLEIGDIRPSPSKESQFTATNIASGGADNIINRPIGNQKKRIKNCEYTSPKEHNHIVFSGHEKNEQNSRIGEYVTNSGTNLLHDVEIGSSPFSRVSSYKLSYSRENLSTENFISDLKSTPENNLENCSSNMEKNEIPRNVDCHNSTIEIERLETIQHDSVSSQSLTSVKRGITNVTEANLPSKKSLPYGFVETSDEKGLCVEPQSLENIRKTKSVPPSSVKETSTVSIDNQGVKIGKWSKTLEIRSPPPPIGNSSLFLEDLITKSLHILAERGRLEQNFKPSECKRDLQPTERGYWYVTCSSWDRELRIRCWNCLGTYIEKDNSAGWGVWCVRDENFEFIRVYSWGIIVGHIYLLLRMASEGKVSKTGACWIDADGKEVVKMCGNI
ncbi:hypothetical protein EV44_g0656 [Erysiphe necator]|uniref:Uncharacterized protein n=1 Tax=Uncinula necator TaxID=52586 RepID=A0A0B1PCR5_UNCNE|nr:hypothetical protein EV44_g0656 [Erysiphe necator]